MGCDQIFTCLDCEKHYDLGYGSYSTWVYAVDMDKFREEVEAIWERRAIDAAALRRNQALRECIQEHDGHEVHLWSHDYACVEDGKLVIASGPCYEVLADNVNDFDWVICGEE